MKILRRALFTRLPWFAAKVDPPRNAFYCRKGIKYQKKQKNKIDIRTLKSNKTKIKDKREVAQILTSKYDKNNNFYAMKLIEK